MSDAPTHLYGLLALAVLGTNGFSVAFYGYDKLAAIRGWSRVREDTLHFWALIGGWPGAWLAQKLFRHKTVKRSFRTKFWATVIVNVTLIVWLVSSWGRETLQQLMTFLP